MPWVTAKGIRYYRRSRRVDGRVVTAHVGRGPAAESIAALDELARAARRADADRDRRLAEPALAAARALRDADRVLAGLFAAAAFQSGWYRHRRQWRRRRPTSVPRPEAHAVDTTLTRGRGPAAPPRTLAGIPEPDRAALAAAARGDPEGLKVATKYLEDPRCRSLWGDPMAAARAGLVSVAAGADPVAALAINDHSFDTARRLGWDGAGTLERMAITRMVHNWLAVAALEGRASELDPAGRSRSAVERCLSQAERRLAQAVRLLATLRRVPPAEVLGAAAAAPSAPHAAAPKVAPVSTPAPAAPPASDPEAANRRSSRRGSGAVRPEVIPGHRFGLFR